MAHRPTSPESPSVPATFAAHMNTGVVVARPEDYFDPADHRALAEPAPTPHTVDTFLEANTELFRLSEVAWSSVKTVLTTLKRELRQGLHAEIVPHEDLCVWSYPTSKLSPVQRKNAAGNGPIIFAMLSRMGRETAEQLATSILDAGQVPLSPSLKHVVEHAKGTRSANTMASQLPERISDAHVQLNASYNRAFLAHHIALRRITGFLQDTDQALPFADRLLAIHDLRQNGIVEYTGLLEIVGSATAQAPHGQASMLETAVETGHVTALPFEAFVTELFTSSEPEQTLAARHTETFLAQVVGARRVTRSIAAAIGVARTAQLTAADILEDPGDGSWLRAHAQEVSARTAQHWGALREVLKLYNRRGRHRLVDIEHVDADTLSRPGVKRARKRLATQTGYSEEVTEPEVVSQRPQLGQLLNVAGSRMHTIGETAYTDPLEHPEVARFLKQHSNDTALKEALLASLQQLVEAPTDRQTTKPLTDQTIAVAHTSRRYPVRRYRPGRIKASHSPLQSRLRIKYVLFPGKSQATLAIQEITLRDGDSY